jgi:glycosyltransferase involved in cell wall biosynthesis
VRVLVNAVAARAGGGSRHLGPFMRGLADALPGAMFNVYVTTDFTESVLHPRVKWLNVDVPSGLNLRRLMWDNRTVRRIAKTSDLILSPLNFGPILPGTPHVLFQRNLSYFEPAYFRREPPRHRLRYGGYRWLAVAESNAAESVIVPSEAMAVHLRRYMHDRSKIHVVPHGFEASEARRLSTEPLIDSAEGWSQGDVRLLHVGHPSRNKNLKVLPKVLAELAADISPQRVTLAVTFGRRDRSGGTPEFYSAAERLGVAEQISFLGPVPNRSLYPLYAKSSALLFPSTCESFGYPVLEAFACGTHVVASDIMSLSEVSGGLALHHPPHDHRSAAAMVRRIVDNHDVPARDALMARSHQFSWTSQCSRVAQIIEAVLN